MKQELKKYLKFEDYAKSDDAYTSLRGYAVNIRKPNATDEGVEATLSFRQIQSQVANVTAIAGLLRLVRLGR